MIIKPITVEYSGKTVFTDFVHTFPDNSVTAILGPSGCGKTTLLLALAEQLRKAGRVSFVFQEPRLIPWYSLEKNIALVLDGSRHDTLDRARHYLEKVHLGTSAKKLPRHLSGGERQRVSIARAFSCRSSVLLMDEPFQSQDSGLRTRLVDTFLELQESEHRTVIAVTHDVGEAQRIADTILVLGGRPAHIVHQCTTEQDCNASDITSILADQSRLFSAIQQQA